MAPQSLNDLDNATLHIDGQSTEVDAPPDIIDVVDEDDDIIDDEEAFLHDLANSDDEDLINVDDDGVDKAYSSEMLHGPTAVTVAVKIVPLHTMYPPVAEVASLTETQFDLRPHMESPEWTKDQSRHPAALAKSVQYQQGCFRGPALGYRHPNRDLQCEEDQRQSLVTQECTSLIDTFFVAYTVNVVFTQDEDRLIYEMRRLEATGTYTNDEINRLARRGKQQGYILSVDRVFPARVTAGPSRPAPKITLKSLHKKVNFMMSLFKSDSKFSDTFSQFKSAGASGSGGCEDDEESADDQKDEDEDSDGDS
uniref:F-box domain, leucine-rich repeat domain, L domain-like protein n=1 Tax=Tanacetum cinerariifolium TaxID=118510 RepID=A0A6L2LI91_TANCI|nr:F-box domain, leucine-rich repeat domain, L domain-like protein [Tanacetum cinerariifolium]